MTIQNPITFQYEAICLKDYVHQLAYQYPTFAVIDMADALGRFEIEKVDATFLHSRQRVTISRGEFPAAFSLTQMRDSLGIALSLMCRDILFVGFGTVELPIEQPAQAENTQPAPEAVLEPENNVITLMAQEFAGMIDHWTKIIGRMKTIDEARLLAINELVANSGFLDGFTATNGVHRVLHGYKSCLTPPGSGTSLFTDLYETLEKSAQELWGTVARATIAAQLDIEPALITNFGRCSNRFKHHVDTPAEAAWTAECLAVLPERLPQLANATGEATTRVLENI